MFKSLDILIGLTVVMLALSMAVTVITQSITTIINSRGKHLRRGLTDLLQQLDPGLNATSSKAVATRVLTHPLVSGSNTPMSPDGSGEGWWAQVINWARRITGGPRLGNVVHREEFTKLLMTLAVDGGRPALNNTARKALRNALVNNGVTDPAATLKNIRALALQIERSHPDLPHMAMQNIAILEEAGSDLVAKINSWFDQTMDRTSQRFTASTRAITFAGALIVAFGLQVDTPSLVNRLAADDELRAAFVAEGKALYADQQAQAAERAKESAQEPAPQPGAAPATQRAASDPEEMARKYRSFLAANGVIRLPSSEGWWDGWKNVNLFGVLITALLLSLGAPFWYSALSRLLQLRSVIAGKDDAQRAARQQSSDLTPVSTSASTRAAAVIAGERGDLTAVG